MLVMVCANTAFMEGSTGTLGDVTFSEKDAEGFLFPVPDGWSRKRSGGDNSLIASCNGQISGHQAQMDICWYLPSSPYHFAEDPEVAEKEIRSDFEKVAKGLDGVEQEFVDIDGHPAGLLTYIINGSGNRFGAYSGRIVYVRNTRYLMICVYIIGNDPEKTPRVTMDDLKMLAGKISYDAEKAPFTAAKATFTVQGKDGVNEIVAGKPLQLEAVFDDQEAINQKEKNNGVNWTAVNAETGAEEPLVSISGKGQLKVDKNLAAPLELAVTGTSVAYGTKATCRVKVLPVITGISLEPAELFFYEGSNEPQTVKASLIPDTMPPTGITWTPAKADTLEIKPAEDGSASIRPLVPGKTSVKVTEPGGKSASLNVSVVAPVEAVELTASGKVKAGGTVSVKAALSPKGAGNTNVEWSLDVGEDVATINEKGQVKISKEAAPGTKITVTCKALGAPEPVVATLVLEVP
jgi:hypothetical protein